MLGVDGHEDLDDVIFGQSIENDRRHVEDVEAELLDVVVEREQAMLAVDGAQDALTLGDLQDAEARPVVAQRLELQRFLRRDDHRPGDRGQVAGLAALLVVLHQLLDLLADDLALIRLLVGGNAPLQQVPIHLGLTLAASHGLMALVPVAQHFEADQLADIAGSERRLKKVHLKLLHANGCDGDHRVVAPSPGLAVEIVSGARPSTQPLFPKGSNAELSSADSPARKCPGPGAILRQL